MPYSTWMLSVVELVLSAGQEQLRTRLKTLADGVLSVLSQWDGSAPRLCYVSDAGDFGVGLLSPASQPHA